MAAHNEHTGDVIRSKKNSKLFLDNYDKVFGKKDKRKQKAKAKKK